MDLTPPFTPPRNPSPVTLPGVPTTRRADAPPSWPTPPLALVRGVASREVRADDWAEVYADDVPDGGPKPAKVTRSRPLSEGDPGVVPPRRAMRWPRASTALWLDPGSVSFFMDPVPVVKRDPDADVRPPARCRAEDGTRI